MPITTKASRRLRFPFLFSLVPALLLLLPLSLVACSDDNDDDNNDTLPRATVTSESTQGTPGGGATTPAAEDVVIELTEDGFTPDRVEVPAGTRVMLRNATGAEQEVVVNGRSGTGGDEISVPEGESVELDMEDMGAYVLTLADDPLITASVVIS